jgi:hypothetical protein
MRCFETSGSTSPKTCGLSKFEFSISFFIDKQVLTPYLYFVSGKPPADVACEHVLLFTSLVRLAVTDPQPNKSIWQYSRRYPTELTL